MSSTEVNLTWAKSTDNKAVRGYDIYRNGQLVFTTDAGTLRYSDADLAPSTRFTYTVDAFDGSGNHSALSAPAVASTSPPGSCTISGNVAGVAGGATLAYTDGTPKTASTDGSGNYSLAVPNGWSGTVIPSKAGYTFTPTQKSYSTLSDDATGQDFDATAATYTLTITSAHGIVNRSDSGAYHYGDVVQLTAIPDAGWSFANWTGDAAGTANPISITMTGDRAVTANYSSNAHVQAMRSTAATDGWVLESTETSNVGGCARTPL